MSDFSVKIYGCRGSVPVSGPQHSKYGGETSCAVVRAGSRIIVFDAGSGIRTFGHELNGDKDVRVYVFFSHSHFDHFIGLPYFNPMYRPDATVHMWGPRDSRFGSFEKTIDAVVRPPYHPVSLFEMLGRQFFHDIGEEHTIYFLKGKEEPLQLRARHPDERDQAPADEDVEVKVTCMRGYNHPKSGVNIYRIEHNGRSLVYATDTEGYVQGDRRLINFAKGCNVIIHDAMYTEERYTSMPVPTQGYGHSTVGIATQLAKDSGVEKLILWHHDPLSTDDDLDAVAEMASKQFSGTVVGRDGLEIDI